MILLPELWQSVRATIPIAALLAYANYRLVEKPFIKLGHRLSRSAKSA